MFTWVVKQYKDIGFLANCNVEIAILDKYLIFCQITHLKYQKSNVYNRTKGVSRNS